MPARTTRPSDRPGCVQVRGSDLQVGDVITTLGPHVIERFAPVTPATTELVGPARAAMWATSGVTVPDTDWVTIRDLGAA